MAKSPRKLQIIPNLVQGVSQQAVHNRRDTQCEAQRNCINSALLGAVARPPADFIKLFSGRVWTNAHFSETSHGNDENYLIGVDSTGHPFAVDLADGTDCTVTITSPDLSYLTYGSQTSRQKLRTQVADDFAFITNRLVTPAMSGSSTASKVNEALIFVRATAYNTTFTVSASGISASHTTSSTTVEQTSSIAGALNSGLNTGGYTCNQYGSVLHLRRNDGAAFSVTTTDGNGDDLMRAFNGTCSSIDRLPSKAPTGVILRVAGESGTGDDDYYVQFQGDPSTGQWVEVAAPGVLTALNSATMPHALVTTGYRTFELRRITYGSRVAGDADTAREPSFVGKSIRDMAYYQRRLFMLHPSGVVMSKTQNPYVYFPDTVQTVLATAPIDFNVSPGDKRGATTLDFATASQDSLFLWSQRAQYSVTSQNDQLKQDTVEVKLAMSYEYAKNVYPMPMGNFIFLVTDTGSSSSMKALTFSQGKLLGDVDVMGHATQYIPSGVVATAQSETMRHVFLVSSAEPSVICMFSYTYDPQQGFIQTAVNKWDIPGGDILWLGVRSNSLRIVQQRAEGVAYMKIDLTPLAVDPVAGAKYTTRLDLRVPEYALSGLVYDAGTKTTTLTLPYQPTSDADVLVATRADKSGGYRRGRSFEVVSTDGYTVTVKGDLRDYQFYVGHRITAIRQESEFLIRSDKGALPADRLDIYEFFLYLSETGYTRVEVSAPNKQTAKYEHGGLELGGQFANVGTPVPRNGHIRAAVGENSENATITIINDSFLPSYWQSAAYLYGAVGWGGD